MLKVLRSPKILGPQKEITYNRRRIQLEIGFKEQTILDGRKVREGDLGRLLGRGGQARLVAGIGSGTTDSEGQYLDMAALAEGSTAKVAFQGFSGGCAVTFSEVPSDLLGETYPWLPLFTPDMRIYPMARIMLAYTEVELEKGGCHFMGKTQDKADFMDILRVAREMVVPGDAFAIIAGRMSEVEYKPLETLCEGAPDGRWLWKGSEGYIVASLDTRSHKSVHACAMVPGEPGHGGRISGAIVDGGAEVMLLKAHEHLQVHCS